jgi:hypothetical protein
MSGEMLSSWITALRFDQSKGADILAAPHISSRPQRSQKALFSSTPGIFSRVIS